MAKEFKYRPRTSASSIRKAFTFFYREKFFNMWMSKYEFVGLNYQQKHYFMKKLWGVGTIACSQIKSSDNVLAGLIEDGSVDMGENSIILTPWTFAERYNIYDFPTHATLINTRGVKFITPKILEIDKEVVIGWAQKNHKSVFSSIEAKIDELVDIEMKKRVARKSQGQPILFAFSPEDAAQAKRLQEQLEADEPYIFIPTNDPDRIKGFTSGAPYIVDKFDQDLQGTINTILTMIGVNNIGISEKKEHLTVDEVNANNEDIEQNSSSYKSEIEEFWDRVYGCFGYRVRVIDLNETFKEAEDETDEKEDNDDE